MEMHWDSEAAPRRATVHSTHTC
eukprot:COSAG02_NODE_17561_length_995_cov_0.860491_2_plen_22_part_01